MAGCVKYVTMSLVEWFTIRSGWMITTVMTL